MDAFLIFGLIGNVSLWLLLIIGIVLGCVHYVHKTKEKYLQKEKEYGLDNALLRIMYNMVSDCIILIDKSGTVMRVNKKLLEYYGRSEDKIIGKNYQRFHTDFNYEEHKNGMELNFDLGSTYTLSVNFYKSDRSIIPFEVEIHRFIFEEKTYFGIVAKDKKWLEEREKYIEEQSGQLMEIEHIAGLGHWELNQQTKEVMWSRELYEILGCEINTVKPNLDLLFSMVHKVDQERVTKAFLEAFQNQQTVDISHQLVNKKNKVIDVIVRIRHVFSDKSEHLSTIGIVQNITEQKEMREHLAFQNQFSKAVVDNSDLLVLTTDEKENIMDVNPFIEEITGRSKDELIGTPAQDIFGQFRYMPGKKSRAIRDKNGRKRWIYWNSRMLPYYDNQTVIVGVGLDVSEGVEYREKFEYLAYHDPVTDLPNRLKLRQVLNHYFEKNAKKPEKHIVLLNIFLAQYNRINDLHGYQIVDQIVKQVCDQLSEEIGCYGLLARHSDDTLIMFLPNHSAREKIEPICKKILATLNKRCQVDQKNFTLGGQIGIAKYPKDARTKDELVRFADAALNQARMDPERDYCFFNENLRKNIISDQCLLGQSAQKQKKAADND